MTAISKGTVLGIGLAIVILSVVVSSSLTKSRVVLGSNKTPQNTKETSTPDTTPGLDKTLTGVSTSELDKTTTDTKQGSSESKQADSTPVKTNLEKVSFNLKNDNDTGTVYVSVFRNGKYYNIPESLASLTDAQLELKISTAQTGAFEIPNKGTQIFGNTISGANWKTANLNWSNVQLLSHLIMSEAGDEPYSGKLAVGSVVLNRMKYSNSSIADVIYQPWQFDGTQTEWFLANPNAESIKASEETINGERVTNALHFANLNLCSPTWATDTDFIERIGNHWFFK